MNLPRTPVLRNRDRRGHRRTGHESESTHRARCRGDECVLGVAGAGVAGAKRKRAGAAGGTNYGADEGGWSDGHGTVTNTMKQQHIDKAKDIQ